jgi:anti-sigma regulatory factor (Ser/Thr protein kinase)
MRDARGHVIVPNASLGTLEASQNVAKYAEATRATVTLSDGDGRLRFEVTDDGVGSTRAARHTTPACRGSLTGSLLLVGKSTSGRRPGLGRP